jgi:hypothetical protein
MPGQRLFKRKWQISIADIDVSMLDCEFNIRRNLRSEPNTCEITIYNLKRQNIDSIIRNSQIDVEVKAGYEDELIEPTLLFRGWTKTEAYASTDKTENILKVKATDGGRMMRRRIQRAYRQNTPLPTVLRELASAMGVQPGNIDSFINEQLQSSRQSSFVHGFVASGQATELFDNIVRSQRLRWSIQNGAIQIMRQGRSRTQIVVSLDSGQILGSPTKDKDGKVTVSCLIQAGLEPGQSISINSRFIQGTFEIQQTEYKGSTLPGNTDWTATMVLKPLQTAP